MGPIYTPFGKKTDTNSIKTTTLLSFVGFAVVLIAIVWTLTTFFIDRYYSTIRAQEAKRVANTIEEQFSLNGAEFEDFAIKTASTYGIFVRIDRGDEVIFSYGASNIRDAGSFYNDIKTVRDKMLDAGKSSIALVIKGQSTDSRAKLVYAAEVEHEKGNHLIYIIAPLYPDQGTILTFQNMLLYVTLIVLVIAIVLAIYLSKRITAPIQSITESAKELSHGNYNVRFNGSEFTETRELAKTLNQASYEMEKTDFYQREIIANVSHDLKTPLTMIRGYAEKIMDISGDNPEKRNSDLNIIIAETERLNKLVSDMMTVSNLQSNKISLNKEVFNFVDAAEEVFEAFRVLNESEGFDISFQACKPAYVHGDKNKIMQVMSNFVSNAVKYSGDNKYVKIELKRTAKKVIFHCVDHGLGIPQDELQHVWDRYYRTSANHERDIEGTGLGLSIVKGILTLHNASYGVKSDEGKGSDFWFEMDIVKKINDGEKNGKES